MNASSDHTTHTTSRESEYERIVDDLSYRYAGTVTRDQPAPAVAAARAVLEPASRIPAFLPLLVERHALDQLIADAHAAGRTAKRVPELLFVCVHNAGRSQMAPALAERGVTLDHAYPKPLTDSVLHAADVIVTMGCGDSCPVLRGNRYEDWDVDDPADQPIETLRRIRDDIEARLTALLADVLDQVTQEGPLHD